MSVKYPEFHEIQGHRVQHHEKLTIFLFTVKKPCINSKQVTTVYSSWKQYSETSQTFNQSAVKTELGKTSVPVKNAFLKENPFIYQFIFGHESILSSGCHEKPH